MTFDGLITEYKLIDEFERFKNKKMTIMEMDGFFSEIGGLDSYYSYYRDEGNQTDYYEEPVFQLCIYRMQEAMESQRNNERNNPSGKSQKINEEANYFENLMVYLIEKNKINIDNALMFLNIARAEPNAEVSRMCNRMLDLSVGNWLTIDDLYKVIIRCLYNHQYIVLDHLFNNLIEVSDSKTSKNKFCFNKVQMKELLDYALEIEGKANKQELSDGSKAKEYIGGLYQKYGVEIGPVEKMPVEHIEKVKEYNEDKQVEVKHKEVKNDQPRQTFLNAVKNMFSKINDNSNATNSENAKKAYNNPKNITKKK